MIATLAGVIAQAVLLLALAPLLAGVLARAAVGRPSGARDYPGLFVGGSRPGSARHPHAGARRDPVLVGTATGTGATQRVPRALPDTLTSVHHPGYAARRPVSSVLQEWLDLLKWLRRGPAHPRGGPGAIAPSLALGAALTAGALTPTMVLQAPLGESGDLVALVALLALGRAARTLCAFEAGGQPGTVLRTGHELAVGTLSEPILLLSLLAVALIAHHTDLPALAVAANGLPGPARGLAFLGAAGVALLEGRQLAASRPASLASFSVPRATEGDPEVAGSDHALLRWARLVRYLVILSVLAAVFLPWGLGSAGDDTPARLVLGGVLYLAKVFALGLALRLLDVAASAKRRPPSEGEVLGGALLCAVLGLIVGGVTHA